MNKFWIMLFHTYISKLLTKSFIISTAITVAVILFITNLHSIISIFQPDQEEKQKIAVVDQTNTLFKPFSRQLKLIDTDKDIDIQKAKKSEKAIEKDIRDDKLDGMFIITKDKSGELIGTYKALTVTDDSVSQKLQQALTQTKTAIRTLELHVSEAELNHLFAPVAIQKIALKEGAKSEEEIDQVIGLVYVILFIIYYSIIMYASMIAMEVATEKSSRVMEILISSVSPVQQMFAKLLGISLIGVTQLGILFLTGFISLKLNDGLSKSSSIPYDIFNLSDIPIQTIIYAVIFFLLGYFLYATLAAFLGSIVSRIEDVQQTIAPMTFLIIAGFMIAMFGIRTPETPFITVTSFIPFFTPMIMFLRVGMLNIPMWEVAIGIGVTLLTIIILAIIGARIYKGGVLIYGKSNGIKDIKRALNLSKNTKS